MRELDISATEIKVVDTDLDCTHDYPIGWIFGGADGTDPRADPRWLPSSYQYIDTDGREIWITSEPVCDEDAIDKFTWVRDTFDCMPRLILVRRPGETVHIIMPYVYDYATDEAREVAR